MASSGKNPRTLINTVAVASNLWLLTFTFQSFCCLKKKKILIILCVNYTIGMGLPVPSHPQACAGKVRMIVSNIITVIRIQNNSNSLIQDNMLLTPQLFTEVT